MPLLQKHPPIPAHQEASHPSTITMKSEIIRKMIHLTSILIPILTLLLGRTLMLWLLVPATVLSFIVELSRFHFPAVERVMRMVVGPILRDHELAESHAKITGSTWVFLSAVICIAVFPPAVMAAAFTVLVLGDTAAALFGRRFGRHKFLEKSVEGSSAFVVFALIAVGAYTIVFGAPWQYFMAGAVASLVAAAAEAFSYGVNVDDNLTIPTSFGLVQWGILSLYDPRITEGLWEWGRGFMG